MKNISNQVGNSRTKKSLLNSGVSLIFQILSILIQFVARKVFLDYLGTEILGLNTTVQNLLQFLNLAELGIGTAISFTLFKPLAENNKQEISEIIDLQGKIYKRIALFLLFGSAILMCFFPKIFSKIELPLWYAYASFGVYLIGSLLTYFLNYRQVLLSASQQDYKITLSYKAIMIFRNLVAIFVIKYSANPFIGWLIIELLFSLLASISLAYVTRRTFPEIRNSKHTFKYLRTKYRNFTTKIKQLFFHKIGAFALTQTSPLIIYAYASLTLVALYGNYIVIINGVMVFFSSIFNSVGAGIGNLVVEGDKAKIKNIFFEIQSLYFLIASVVCYTMFVETSNFISLWIGSKYVLPSSTLALIISTLFIFISRWSIDHFILAYGLYGDVLSPLIEAILNIGLSIWFGNFWGLNGILLGVLVSQIIIIVLWKPYYLISRCFSGMMKTYWTLVCKHIGCLIISAYLCYKINGLLFDVTAVNLWTFLLGCICNALTMLLCMLFLLYVFRTGIKYSFYRFNSLRKTLL